MMVFVEFCFLFSTFCCVYVAALSSQIVMTNEHKENANCFNKKTKISFLIAIIINTLHTKSVLYLPLNCQHSPHLTSNGMEMKITTL